MAKNTPEHVKEIAETRLHELLRCARTCAAKEIKLLPGGIEIILDSLLPTPLIRAAVSLQECYPDGGVYVTYLGRSLILCVYYMED